MVQLLCVLHDARIRRVHAVHIGIDLAHVGLQRCCQRHCGGIGAAATQGGHCPGFPVDSLETGDQADLVAVQRFLYATWGHAHDARIAVALGGEHACLGAGEGLRFRTQRFDGHGHQRVGDALARGEQHVHFAGWWHRVDLLGEVQQFIGGVSHCGADNDYVVPLLLGLHDALSHAPDAFGALQRRSAVFLDDECHVAFTPLGL